jgi:hypothetical protein
MKTLITLITLALFTLPVQAQRGGWHSNYGNHYGGGHYYGGSHYYNNYGYHRPSVVVAPRVYIAPRPYYYHPYYRPIVVAPPIFYPPVPVISINRTVVTQPQVVTDVTPQPATQVTVMNDADFNTAYNSVRNQVSDDARLAVAEEVADANYLTSSQVRSMMSAFASDGSKLAFAEYAYDHVADPNNYYIVNDVFTSEKSVQTLSKYISGK